MKYKLIGLYVIIILFYLFIEIKNKIKIKTQGGSYNKQVYKYNDKYYYLYKKKENYYKYLDIYNKLKHYNFIPKILYNNDYFLLIVSEDSGEKLNKSMKINNFKYQINRIKSILEKHNIIHNDITLNNIVVKDNIIYLIDWDLAFYKIQKNPRGPNNLNLLYCNKLPEAKNNNITSYVNNKKCFSWNEKYYNQFGNN